MEWFGWLTKGKCEVSVLDGFMFLAEAAFLLGAFYLVLVIIEKTGKR